MGPFETAGGDEHIYGQVGILLYRGPTTFRLYRGSAALRAWLYCFNVEPCLWAFTVQAGASHEWSPWELDEAYRYPSKEAARAACDAYVAALYLSGEVREVVVTISIDPVSGQ